MIPQVLHQLDAMKQTTNRSWRSVCAECEPHLPLPYASVMRWRQRQRLNLPVCQLPGPKKTVPLNPAEFYPLFRQLRPGRLRTRGVVKLYKKFASAISRRQLAGLVQDLRWDQLANMKRIDWLYPGVVWAIDATEYGPNGEQIITVTDLASRYSFPPLVVKKQDGHKIAAYLRKLFKKYGPPLFCKRDNGSPFNCQPVDELLAEWYVFPLNNPPYWPRYNGAKEKSIRDLKEALDQRQLHTVATDLALLAEVTTQELNHRPKRCLKNRTACAVFHDAALRRRWTKTQRKQIFRLLLQQFGAMIEKPVNGNHPSLATLWRVTAESWLRCQKLITVRQNQKPNVSTTLPKIWSHN